MDFHFQRHIWDNRLCVDMMLQKKTSPTTIAFSTVSIRSQFSGGREGAVREGGGRRWRQMRAEGEKEGGGGGRAASSAVCLKTKGIVCTENTF